MLSNEEKKKKSVVKMSSQQSSTVNEIERNCDVKPEDISHVRVERPEHQTVRIMRN